MAARQAYLVSISTPAVGVGVLHTYFVLHLRCITFGATVGITIFSFLPHARLGGRSKMHTLP